MPRVNGYAPGSDRRGPLADCIERRVERFDLALAVVERNVALLPLVITLPPRRHLGAQAFELCCLTTQLLVALVGRSARKISHRRHDRVRVKRSTLRLSSASATVNGVAVPDTHRRQRRVDEGIRVGVAPETLRRLPSSTQGRCRR